MFGLTLASVEYEIFLITNFLQFFNWMWLKKIEFLKTYEIWVFSEKRDGFSSQKIWILSKSLKMLNLLLKAYKMI